MGKTVKNADFRPINRYISETIEYRHVVRPYDGKIMETVDRVS